MYIKLSRKTVMAVQWKAQEKNSVSISLIVTVPYIIAGLAALGIRFGAGTLLAALIAVGAVFGTLLLDTLRIEKLRRDP